MEAHAEFMVNRVFGVNMKGVSVACLTLVAVFLAAAITARKLRKSVCVWVLHILVSLL